MHRRARMLGALLAATLFFSLLGAAVAAAQPPRAAVSHGAAATQTVQVSVSDVFAFTLSTNEITPGDSVTVTITDLGTTAHTFTLSPIANFAFNSSDSTTHLLQFFAVHPPLVNLSVNGTPGETYSQTFTAPAYGEYEYVCLEPGHFNAGMFGFLGSGEPGTGSTVATGPGWQVFAIVGGVASLVILTIVLAFVFGQREGTKHEMPPERLGYPEGPRPPADGEAPTPPQQHG